MRVSNGALVALCSTADESLERGHRLFVGDLLALDLRDARARVAELEAALAEARRDGERLDYMVESTNTGNDLIALWLLEDALDLLDPEDVYSDAALRHAVRQMIDKHMMRSELGAAIAAAAADASE